MRPFIVINTKDGSVFCSDCMSYFPNAVDHVVYTHKIDPYLIKKHSVCTPVPLSRNILKLK